MYNGLLPCHWLMQPAFTRALVSCPATFPCLTCAGQRIHGLRAAFVKYQALSLSLTPLFRRVGLLLVP
jgi:hypothetical protein